MQRIQRVLGDYRFWGWMFLVATVVLAYLSLVRAPTIRVGLDFRNWTVHFIAYFVYGAVAARWRSLARPSKPSYGHFLEGSVPTALYGVLLEWVQIYLPHRDSDPVDGMCNVLGAIVGAAIVSFLVRNK